ncbi:MAG: RNA polymerase sigma factor [Planctomycetes bacterium]|nr:RNA polymerase sigma factor [Planctomycetota bacterium]
MPRDVPAIPPSGPSGPPRDRDLVLRILEGQTDAFEQLVARYQKAVFTIAYYKSKNLFDAEDLTQDIFLAAFSALPTLKDRENFAGWLFGIAHNRCHKWYRREHTKIIKIKEIRQQKEQEARLAQRTPEEGQEQRRLAREIDNLPHEIRQVLVLKYLEGLSYEAIEARLGIKAYRIDYLIRKGKALLKQKLGRTEAAGDDP